MWNSDSKNNGDNHSRGNGENEHSIELCGWDIKRVDGGLDETQVGSIISELIGQRDELAKKTEHLSSLTKLAEKTVAEADEFAKQLKAEAVENAEAEKVAVMAGIEEETHKLQDENERVRVELRNAVDGISRELMALPETFNKQLMNVWNDCESRLNEMITNRSNRATNESATVDTGSEEPVQAAE